MELHSCFIYSSISGYMNMQISLRLHSLAQNTINSLNYTVVNMMASGNTGLIQNICLNGTDYEELED